MTTNGNIRRAQRLAAPPVHIVNYVPRGYDAITLPPFGIFIKPQWADNARLLAHERAHWAQYNRMGLLGYYLTYLAGHLQYGYDGNPMEVEARFISGENPDAIRNYTEAVRTGNASTIFNPDFRK